MILFNFLVFLLNFFSEKIVLSLSACNCLKKTYDTESTTNKTSDIDTGADFLDRAPYTLDNIPYKDWEMLTTDEKDRVRKKKLTKW